MVLLKGATSLIATKKYCMSQECISHQQVPKLNLSDQPAGIAKKFN